MKVTSHLLISLMLILSINAYAQNVAINDDGSAPDGSAMLDVKSSDKGFLPPRMTSVEKFNIDLPATGLLFYQTDGTAGYYYNSGTPASPTWTKVGVASDASQWTTAGSAIYYNGGNVGIGTTTPTNKLHIVDARTDINSASISIEKSGTVDGTSYGLSSSVSGTAVTNIGARFSATGATNNYGLLVEDGNVGIGTTEPYGKLDVRGGVITQTTTDFSLNSDGTAIGFSLGSQTGNTYGKITVGTAGDNTYGNLALLPGGGNVGIGVTNPIYPLQVDSYKEIENQAGYYFSGTTPTITANHGNWNVGIYSVNSILTSGAFVAFSDLRIKENIKEIPHSLDLVRKLRPVTYNKIDKIENGGRTEFGFIAQEVEKILPEAVNTGTGEIPVLKPFDKVEFEDGVSYTILVKNGDNIVEQKYTTKDPRPEGEIIVKSKTVDDFKSLSYDMIFTVAVDAIREQQAQIEAQQGQLAFQQAQIDALKAQNAVLTQKAESFDQLKAEVENLKKLVNSNLSQLTINQ